MTRWRQVSCVYLGPCVNNDRAKFQERAFCIPSYASPHRPVRQRRVNHEDLPKINMKCVSLTRTG
ncbi:hypothetical protein EXIGLDRAFT_716901 [Exidia glandulosa HHB12029]|uniref:Uncharacterized protein n=1 Tax=Exidia glandulosa HHB12029 TaxID=1314781 RepID=A0A166ANB8_EXIGL|nr:hypothetical protein EXIGLDRAFT_716901 [Exidia glandulosa HHB12029]